MQPAPSLAEDARYQLHMSLEYDARKKEDSRDDRELPRRRNMNVECDVPMHSYMCSSVVGMAGGITVRTVICMAEATTRNIDWAKALGCC